MIGNNKFSTINPTSIARTREERVFVFNPNLAIRKKRIITRIVMINADVKSRVIFEHFTFKIDKIQRSPDVNNYTKSYKYKRSNNSKE